MMHKLKTGVLIAMLAAGTVMLSGCDQVDETILETNADLSVNINVPYATNTPLPESLNVPDQVVIDSDGSVIVNDASLLGGYSSNAQSDESNYETLSLGSTGTAVQNLQQRLSDLGYFTQGVSGVFDDATQKAVKRFERTYGVMQTGIATPSFQSKLFSDDAPAYGSEDYENAVDSHYSTLQRGAVGSSVYALQQRLKELGYPIKDLSGVYDEDTEAAVSLFAQSYGIDNMTVAYIALQKELYSEDAAPYSEEGQEAEKTAVGVLNIGTSGTQVMQIQNRLINLGYMTGSASGYYDSETQNAIMLFESACGVSPTGQLNTELLSLLMSGDAPVYGATYTSEARTFADLSEGSSGEQVTQLQKRLIDLGYASGSASGVYGTETTAAVTLFQRYNGLEETGNATVEVQQSMFALSALSYQDILSGLTYTTPAPDTTPTPVTGAQTLQIGSSGDEVARLQARLNQLGYECSTDGTYDESTANAMKTFQAHVGVSQTGEASESMLDYIYTNAAPASKYTMYNSTQHYIELQEGDSGEDVTRLQQQLWELGYLLTDDVKDSIGTFHDKTKEAVMRAQSAMGYEMPNGVATAEFQCFIFSDYNYFIKK